MYSQTNSEKGNYDGTAKIDSESIVQQYKNLRQQQKQFLNKINLSTKLKSQLFDLEDIRSSNKNATNVQRQNLVVVLDPFKGRLVMGQTDWALLQRQKQEQRRKIQQEIWEQKSKEQRQIMKQRKMRRQEKINEQFQNKQQSQDKQVQDNKKQNVGQKKFMNYFSRLFKKKDNKNKNNQSEQNLKKQSIKKKRVVIEQQRKHSNQQSPQIKKTKSKVQKVATQKIKSNLKGKKQKKLSQNVQYNIKVQGQKEVPPKSQLSIQSAIQNVKIQEKRPLKKQQKYMEIDKVPSKQRIESKKKVGQKKKTIEQEIQQSQMISSIHKRDIKQSQNNPSQVASNKIETLSLEQILRQKNKK